MITVRCYDPTAWIEALAGARYLFDDGRDDSHSPLGCWQSAPHSSIIRGIFTTKGGTHTS
ncbi:unnamed protein product [Musa acuminata subsp. malaccensis]|uniref:(wild Malaysian banana) hypothetical protein n=1 Tax=Musa acuminata subsp. malaccensis TaxID=214687 RepID=A0A804K4P9_MUSAM|nr:unnamed protein product [Musa acuminata subsp. malaccensis]